MRKPASREKRSTRGSRARLPSPPTAAIADMLSVSHSAGTPPSLTATSYMQASRSSRVLVGDLRYRWRLEYPSVAENTLKRYSAPERSRITTSSFQSNWSCSPGPVSKRGCASGEPAPTAMPRVRR